MNDPGWRVSENASLRQRNTFGIDAKARWLLEIDDIGALPAALAQPAWRDAPLLPLGAGSNLLLAGDFDGVALAFRARGVAILGDGETVHLRAQAGLPWHDFVLWSLDHGLCGLENLSLIPGSIGAAPIQNIGAYGVEIGEFIDTVEAFDRTSGTFVRIARADCAFGYRDSVFKHHADRYVIVAVEFRLPRRRETRIGYAGIAEELAAMGVAEPTARDVSRAIVAIRQRKLPDPGKLGNAGSFFKNPIVPVALAESLQRSHDGIPVFGAGDEGVRKISAAWLIEQAGWKGFREGDAGVSAEHALVLVNHGNATGAQLLALARRIAASVREKFGVEIEPEPRIVGASWLAAGEP
ncbi:MAG: UDP-N-acetylmuramate dehydrogenase [Pseudoxanthomonas sp.]